MDFFLILTLGPRNGLGYCVVNRHKVKGEIIIIIIIIIMIIIIIRELQKIALLGTSRILRKTLSIK